MRAKTTTQRQAYYVSSEEAAKRMAESLKLSYNYEDTQVIPVRGHICNCTNMAIEQPTLLAWILCDTVNNRTYVFYIAE